MKPLAYNKRARFDYEFIERYEAGLVLFGHEVKSIRAGRMSLKGAFVTFHKNELFLTNASIPLYSYAGKIENYDPTRPRKLLIHRAEAKSLRGKIEVKGLTMVPISVYNKRGRLKLEFALAKGKKQFDKRETIKKREAERDMGRAMKKV
ncbi:MAG TPA: SsrA-binding protein SmpB [Candidatus Moranbacteria bacterium]|nr:SsrA-binding protein SmpB [Candidatus Moranbacteria bacterium]